MVGGEVCGREVGYGGVFWDEGEGRGRGFAEGEDGCVVVLHGGVVEGSGDMSQELGCDCCG